MSEGRIVHGDCPFPVSCAEAGSGGPTENGKTELIAWWSKRLKDDFKSTAVIHKRFVDVAHDVYLCQHNNNNSKHVIAQW